MRAKYVALASALLSLGLAAAACGGVIYIPAPSEDAGADVPDGDVDQPGDGACGDEYVVVCHITPADPSNPYEICVSAEAVAALAEHGDFVGPCQDLPADDSGDESGDGPRDGDDVTVGHACGSHGNKFLICHNASGNPSDAREICVARPAAAAHLDHGDTTGPCED